VATSRQQQKKLVIPPGGLGTSPAATTRGGGRAGGGREGGRKGRIAVDVEPGELAPSSYLNKLVHHWPVCRNEDGDLRGEEEGEGR